MIVPASEKVKLLILYCPVCRRLFWKRGDNAKCQTKHKSGGCCHFGDIQITETEAQSLVAFTERMVRDREAFVCPEKRKELTLNFGDVMIDSMKKAGGNGNANRKSNGQNAVNSS